MAPKSHVELDPSRAFAAAGHDEIELFRARPPEIVTASALAAAQQMCIFC